MSAPLDVNTFMPMGRRVLVRLDKSPTCSPGGILLAPETVKTESYGRVMARGEEITEVLCGDRVLCRETAGTKVGEDASGFSMVLYPIDDIMCVLEDDPVETPAVDSDED